MEITFKVWSPQRNSNRLFPRRRFYLEQVDGEYIEFAHVSVNFGGRIRDDYEVTPTGDLAQKALAVVSNLASKKTIDGENVIDRKDLERILRASTTNSKTRILGRKGLRDDFKAGLEVHTG